MDIKIKHRMGVKFAKANGMTRQTLRAKLEAGHKIGVIDGVECIFNPNMTTPLKGKEFLELSESINGDSINLGGNCLTSINNVDELSCKSEFLFWDGCDYDIGYVDINSDGQKYYANGATPTHYLGLPNLVDIK